MEIRFLSKFNYDRQSKRAFTGNRDAINNKYDVEIVLVCFSRRIRCHIYKVNVKLSLRLIH
jgi:hypothetical protein